MMSDDPIDFLWDLFKKPYVGFILFRLLEHNQIRTTEDLWNCENPKLAPYQGKRALELYSIARNRLIEHWGN